MRSCSVLVSTSLRGLTVSRRLDFPFVKYSLARNRSNPAWPNGFGNPRASPSLIIRRRSSSICYLMDGANSGRAQETVSADGGARFSNLSNGGEEEDRLVRFVLSPSCLLKLWQGDITKWFVDGSSDATVNAANERMLGGGGVDGAIHRASGPELRAACRDVPEVRPGVRCPTGEARITQAFRLPVSRVIHTVGPIYDVDVDPEASLRSAYRNCLLVAKENNIQFIAFPAISCGVYHYPIKEASRIAITTVREFANDFKEVHFVLFSDDTYDAWLEAANQLL